jgi:excisionase family DNA binding protein
MSLVDIQREWITAREAAVLLSVHPRTVRRACREGLISAVRPDGGGGRWLIARTGLVQAVQGLLRNVPAFRPELLGETTKGKPRKRRASMRSALTIDAD